ncbi:MAG: hypothetical protein ABIH11_00295 [Candidatus Altiarchaeota archaeon]
MDSNRRFNVVAFLVIAGILALYSYTAFASGHPWALTCYQCRACNLNCPLGYDVASYMTAAVTNNPDLYMTASNLQLTVREAYDTDSGMTIEYNGERMTAGEAVKKIPGKTVVEVRELKAKDAARFDPLEGACEKNIPLNLPITDVIRDLKDDGEFNE